MYVALASSKTVYEVANRNIVLIDESRPPILKRIAECESNDMHFRDGEVVRGNVDPNDIGRYQISLTYHGDKARKMGLDLFDEIDNYRYALFLFNNEGTQPWEASRSGCWGG